MIATCGRIGMAIKAGMGEGGFDLWDDWSRSSARYRDTDARGVWRSIRPDGGISLATLFFEAEKHGYVQSRGKAGRAIAAPAARALAAAPGEGGLIPPDQHCNRATVPSYSSRKQLPEAFLRSLDVTEIRYLGGPALRIPYFNREGNEVAVRIRLCLDKDGDRDRRFAWRKGDKPRLYGLWRIGAPESVVLVKGVDCHALVPRRSGAGHSGPALE
jgi:hypothetical protein